MSIRPKFKTQDIQMKFDFDWPAGLRDIHVWKFEPSHRQTHRHQLESHPISSQGAFSSDELINETENSIVFIFFIFTPCTQPKYDCICQMKHCYLICTDYWNMLILSVCLYVQKVKEQVVLLGPLQTQHKFRNTRFTSLPGICQMKHYYPSCTDYWNMLILSVHLSVQ